MAQFDVGIDYSINSPAVCIAKVGQATPDKVWLFYRASKKKNWENCPGDRFCGFQKEEWANSAQRFHQNWSFVKNAIDTCGIDNIRNIWIEGYSYGSRGAIFDLAENVGFLRAGLWGHKLEAIPFAPPTIKKLATGNGHADKDMMYEAWLKEGGLDLAKYWEQKPDSNPISDMIDSYYVLKTGLAKQKTE